MKSYYCRHLYDEINFDVEKIFICCGMSQGPFFNLYDKKMSYKNYLKKLLNWRFSISKKAYLGKIPKECINCLELTNVNISLIEYIRALFNLKKFPLKTLVLKPYRQCEYSCVYCLEKKYTKGKKTLQISKSDFYKFMPILDSLIRNKFISTKDAEICFQGGSISVWDEFIPILNAAHDYGIRKFMYLTNAYAFIPEIAIKARTSFSTIIVSLDCGTRDTYKLIKSDDSFELVKENILKYVLAGVYCGVKYILLKNINDNIDEINKFLEFIKFLKENIPNDNLVSIVMDVDYRDILKEDFVMPVHYKEIINYVINWGKDNDVFVNMQEHVRKLI